MVDKNKIYYVVEEFSDGSLQIDSGKEAEEFIKTLNKKEIRKFKEVN